MCVYIFGAYTTLCEPIYLINSWIPRWAELFNKISFYLTSFLSRICASLDYIDILVGIFLFERLYSIRIETSYADRKKFGFKNSRKTRKLYKIKLLIIVCFSLIFQKIHSQIPMRITNNWLIGKNNRKFPRKASRRWKNKAIITFSRRTQHSLQS